MRKEVILIYGEDINKCAEQAIYLMKERKESKEKMEKNINKLITNKTIYYFVSSNRPHAVAGMQADYLVFPKEMKEDHVNKALSSLLVSAKRNKRDFRDLVYFY